MADKWPGYFSDQLLKIKEECELSKPLKTDEPLLYAQMRFDQVQLALAARLEWHRNKQLYQATIKPWLDEAFQIAEKLEAYQFLETIKNVVQRHRNQTLRHYEMPRALEELYSSKQ